jgi:hypothetical protein
MANAKKKGRQNSAGVPNNPNDIPQIDGYYLTARPDTVDFRDKLYVPTLVEVPTRRPLAQYQESQNPILDQKREGACTGFGLAAVANYLLRTRKVDSDDTKVSPRMLYEMAKRNDEWEGEEYSGSSARGAIKGWHKFGVCAAEKWPYISGQVDRNLTRPRLEDARQRPLGAYYRVNHKDIVAMHSALSEVGILYATASVHKGWSSVPASGMIKFSEENIGGHAFAIVGFDKKGFWIQNSWGPGWGKEGFGHLGYDDWLKNGTDIWVARLGAPVLIDSAEAFASDQFQVSQTSLSASFYDLRPHIISLGNDGVPTLQGDFGNTTDEIREIIQGEIPRITEKWKKRRLLLYAHGGLVGEKGAVQRVADYRQPLLDAQVYPLAFVWHSDFWSTLKNILGEAVKKRKPEGLLDNITDFMLDRLDDTLEPLARIIGGKSQWDEMKENALLATTNNNGGARLVAAEIKKLITSQKVDEIHVVGHSAGSIFMAPLVNTITAFAPIQTLTLWAPACTMALFKQHYLPLLTGANRKIKSFALYTLTDRAERDDHCAHIYHKSLLYLVSQAFEDAFQTLNPKWPGVPLLGMEKFVGQDSDLQKLLKSKVAEWVLSPNNTSQPRWAAGSSSHGGFDDDKATVTGTLVRILGGKRKALDAIGFERSATSIKDRRQAINKLL